MTVGAQMTDMASANGYGFEWAPCPYTPAHARARLPRGFPMAIDSTEITDFDQR